MDRLFAILGAGSAFISVLAGAFGAHALRGRLSPDALATFETAARYEMYHALALLGVAITPFGGVAFLVGWICLGFAAIRAG
jgi:uncharacterized membrane protein YgdD (TMEM256/DUF423 family)